MILITLWLLLKFHPYFWIFDPLEKLTPYDLAGLKYQQCPRNLLKGKLQPEKINFTMKMNHVILSSSYLNQKRCFSFSWKKTNSKLKYSSRGVSWFCSIYTYFLIIVFFSDHLALCLNLWLKTYSSVMYNTISNSFCLAMPLSRIPNKATWK